MKTIERQQVSLVENEPIYEVITKLVIKQLEAGIVPWQKSWKGLPFSQNFASGFVYRGINRITTGLSPYEMPYFLTLGQIDELGGTKKEGEIPIPVVFWKLDKGDEESFYTPSSDLVWNIEQTEGIEWEIPKRENPGQPIDEAEGIVEGMPNPPRIMRRGLVPAYFPTTDTVQVPAMDFFENPHNFYEVLFHQLAHATGTENRLARDTVIKVETFFTNDYSMEHLTAEITSQTLCQIAGLHPNRSFTKSAGYRQRWISELSKNNLFIFLAASQAKRAVDYILG